MSGRLGIARVSPSEIRVGARGTARIRVEGRGYGALRLGRTCRWVWGVFDETFLVFLGEHDDTIAITLRGVGGPARREVLLASCADITSPHLTTTIPPRRASIRGPRVRPIATVQIQAPRLQSLTRAPSSARSQESDSIT